METLLRTTIYPLENKEIPIWAMVVFRILLCGVDIPTIVDAVYTHIWNRHSQKKLPAIAKQLIMIIEIIFQSTVQCY